MPTPPRTPHRPGNGHPKPTGLRILEGNPSHRPLPKNEPQPDAKAPTCPLKVLSDPIAKREWNRVIPILQQMKVLTVAELNIVAALCINSSFQEAVLKGIRNMNKASDDGLGGFVFKSKRTGYLTPNQLMAQYHALVKEELDLCRELGFTPSSRTRIQTIMTKEEDSGGSTLNGHWASTFRGGAKEA